MQPRQCSNRTAISGGTGEGRLKAQVLSQGPLPLPTAAGSSISHSGVTMADDLSWPSHEQSSGASYLSEDLDATKGFNIKQVSEQVREGLKSKQSLNTQG